MSFNWQQEDFYGSMIRGFHQQIFIENRGEDITFIYPKKGDLKLDKEDNPVKENPPILDDNGELQYDSDGNILLDKDKLEYVEYGEPELFFDVKGQGRITQYIPANLANCKPAISQFYVELDGWRKNPIGDGTLQENNVIIFQPDLSQYNSKLPTAWVNLFRKTNMVAKNMLNQSYSEKDFDQETLEEISKNKTF